MNRADLGEGKILSAKSAGRQNNKARWNEED